MDEIIICPYCKHRHRFDYEDLSYTDESSQDHTCDSCGKEFIIVTSVRVKFSTEEKRK